MSLVGFRPALKSEYEEYEYHHKAMDKYRRTGIHSL